MRNCSCGKLAGDCARRVRDGDEHQNASPKVPTAPARLGVHGHYTRDPRLPILPWLAHSFLSCQQPFAHLQHTPRVLGRGSSLTRVASFDRILTARLTSSMLTFDLAALHTQDVLAGAPPPAGGWTKLTNALVVVFDTFRSYGEPSVIMKILQASQVLVSYVGNRVFPAVCNLPKLIERTSMIYRFRI
jgi:hypothetical protein